MKLFATEGFKEFSRVIVDWYERNKRDLPWRHTTDPYKIWLSEIMLQQTRVEQGMSYYHKFVRNYPTINHLADAEEEKVLRDWQGLGYYSRARNLHHTAKVVRDNFKGEFPNGYEEIKSLKGVGDYTAAAIASFAFELPYAVVDGNVFRVLSRVFGIETDISSHEAKREFFELAQELLDTTNPAQHNQAMMEFGSLQCTPKAPECGDCPLNDRCHAFKFGTQNQLPVKLKKTKVTNRFFNYLIVKQGEKLAFQKREAKDIWASLYEFPLIETVENITSDELLKNSGDAIKSVKRITEMKHILSHQRLYCVFWEIDLVQEAHTRYDFFEIEKIKALPKPVLINNFLVQFYF